MLRLKPSLGLSVLLVAAGLLVAFAGYFYYGYEEMYGSGLNWTMGVRTNGPARVISPEAPTQIMDAETGLFFEGTYKEAQAFAERERAKRTNLFLPKIVILAGGGTALVGVFMGGLVWRRRGASQA